MSTQFTNGYALLIGVDENTVSLWALPDVAKDINALAAVLTHPQRCAYPADNIKTLTGQAATRAGILAGLSWLQTCIEKDTSHNATAIVYYSGHGSRDAQGNYYFLPYDTQRGGQLKLSALRAADFAEAVSGLQPQRLLVVLDCCHAGGMGVKDPNAALELPGGYTNTAPALELFMQDEPAMATPANAKGLEALAQGRGRAVLSSSTGAQRSYLRRDGAMSVFTYHLVEALTGHAQPQAGASEVLVTDMMSYVHRQVPVTVQAQYQAAQQPEFQLSGNFPIALLLGGQGLSKGAPAPDPLAPLPVAGTVFDQRGQTVQGEQTNIQGNVNAPILSGNFQAPINIGNIQTGKVSGTGNVIGHGAKANTIVNTGSGAVATEGSAIASKGSMIVGRNVGGNATVSSLTIGNANATGGVFAALHQQVNALPPGIAQEDAQDAVRKLETEAAKGAAADAGRVKRAMETLLDTLPTARAALLTTLAGVNVVFQSVAKRVLGGG